jgi:adenylate cyclase
MLLPESPAQEPGHAPGPVGGWQFGAFAIDLARAQVTRGERRLALERSGYELLRHLVQNAGRTVGKEELLGAAWPGRVVSDHSLTKAISKLRQALGDADAQLIQSVHGYGYRLAAAVEPLVAVPAKPGLALVDRTRPPQSQPGPWPLLAIAGALLVVLALAFIGWRPHVEPGPAAPVAAPGDDVIAVLPLRDASPNGSLALLADGMANHLRDQLQRVPALRFISRADSNALRGDRREPAAIAHELGANLIVDGEVAHAGDQLRVVLRLFDASGRIPGWSRTFERPPYEQAILMEDLRAAVFESIGSQPGRWGHDPQRGRGTANEEAFRIFLRAATLFSGNNDPNNHRRAIVLLEQAIELDPNYADAWLTLGGIYGGAGYYADTVEELVAGRRRAIAAMDRGIALAPDDPAYYLHRSEMRLLYFFDAQGAWADLEAAAARTPGGESATLLVWKARLLASLGRIDEAIAVGARANALNPEAGGRRNQGWHYLAKRDTASARAVLLLQLVDLPENPHSNFYLGLCDIFDGQPDAALRRLEYSSTLFRLVGSAIAHHERGDRAASDIALGKLVDQFAIADGYWVGAVHAWRGEHDQAFEWIERGIDGGDSSVMYLPFDPLLEGIRDDPRYDRLMARLGFPATLQAPAVTQAAPVRPLAGTR